MAPVRVDDDWSDEDEDNLSQIETSVLLGLPDGSVDEEVDLIDAAVSRIGGHPALLPSREPSFSSSQCKSCKEPMELLVQLWCPFEDSPMDRALYVWGCSRVGCQGKDGSIRAWRGLRINEKYAAKLAKKRKRQQEREQAKAKAEEERLRQEAERRKQGNPFSMGGNANPTPIFGLGTQIFGATSSENPEPIENAEDKVDEDDVESGSESESELLTALAASTITESRWASAPSFPPLYLSTVTEYLQPQPKERLPQGVKIEDLGDDDKKGSDVTWAKETYENSLDVDQIFEKFTKRVGYEAEQCIRYELQGTPLPFACDKIFNLLWPAPPSDPLPVTKADFKVVHAEKRVYNPTSVPRCPSCNGPRTFECQLMPNLINVLRSTEDVNKKYTDEERRAEIKKVLKNEDKSAKTGMDWGTVMIFSCQNDCCQEGGKQVKEAWKEEIVYVQWDV